MCDTVGVGVRVCVHVCVCVWVYSDKNVEHFDDL